MRPLLQPAWQAARQACAADVKSLCGDAGGRVGRCLRQNRAKLSEACTTAQADLRRLRQDLRGGAREEPKAD